MISGRCAPAPMFWPKRAFSTAMNARSTGKTFRAFRKPFRTSRSTGGLFEIDRDRFSSAGGTTALDLMLALIASQHGADLAASVAEAILHSPIRHHSEHQSMSLPARIGARHPKLVGIIEEMEGNLEEPLSPSLLAKQAGLSTRQLERLFRRYLDRSPKRYYLELRSRRHARSCCRPTCRSSMWRSPAGFPRRRISRNAIGPSMGARPIASAACRSSTRRQMWRSRGTK